MKITEVKYHLISTNVDANSWGLYDDTGKYLRISKSRWYYVDDKFNISKKVGDHRLADLEKEFQETVNVIHEQLLLL
jgi:hypothetical protein